MRERHTWTGPAAALRRRSRASFLRLPVLWGTVFAGVLLAAGIGLAQEGPFPPGAGDAPPGAAPGGAAPGGAAPGGAGRRGPRRRPEGPPPPNGAKPGAETAPATPSELRITVEPEGVSLFTVGVDAPEVLTQLGEKTGLRIVVDDTINRKITMRLSRRKPKEILDGLVAAYGLACAEVEGVFMVSEGIPRNPSSYLLSDIDSIRTQYVLATTAKQLLPVFLQDHVKVNYEQNSVVLSAPAGILRKFRDDVKQFDIPAAQIAIDLLMVEFTRSGARDWGVQLLDQSRRHIVNVDPAEGSISLRSTIALLPTDFQVRLRALVEAGEARVHANPRIATISGRRASIFIGTQRYISTPVDNGYGGQMNFIDAGVNLEMTPYTGGEGDIITDILTEVSTLSPPNPTTNLPEKSTRRANTSVHVRGGETIILGGLLQKEQRQITEKIAVLGDLPLVGGLFRSSHKESVDTELVIFVTPRIRGQAGQGVDDEERATLQRLLAPDKPAAAPPK